MDIFRRILNDLKAGENYDLYITAVVAITTSGLAIFNVTQSNELLRNLTLIILSLLAIATIGNRHQVKRLIEEVALSSDSVFLEDFPASFNEDLERTNDLWLVGVTLSRTMKTNYGKIEKKLRNNQSIQVLLVHPEGAGVNVAISPTYSPTLEIEKKVNDIKTVLRYLKDLQAANPSKIKVKLTRRPLAYGAFMMDHDGLSGAIYIECYTFRIASDSLPKFTLKAGDGRWFEFYRNEIKTTWNEAEE